MQNTNSATDLRIGYSTHSPNGIDLGANSGDFTYTNLLDNTGKPLGTLGSDGWYSYTVIYTKANNAGLFTANFWFRFESNLATHNPGNIAEYTYVDNVIISVT